VVSRPLLLVALVTGVACAWLAPAAWFVDLEVYRFGGSVLLDDGARLYAENEPASDLPFTYPPFAAALFVPFVAVPLPVLVAAWSAACVLALGLVLDRVLPPAWAPAAVAALTAAALVVEPVRATLMFGQVNLLLLALLVPDLLRPDRRYAGVLTGVAAGIKLTPLLFVVFLLLVRRPTAAARAVGAFAATVALGFVVAPGASTAFWSEVVWDARRPGDVGYASNQSVRGAMTRLAGEQPTLVWFLVAGAVTLGMLLVAARAHRRGHRLLGVSLAGLAMLVASPISWNHHWVWAVPLAVALWPLARGVAVAWLAVFASGCIFWPPHALGREVLWTPSDHVVGNAYLLATLAVTAYAWHVAATRPPTAPPPGRRIGTLEKARAGRLTLR
jgi:alpha-1,2-mannosyltransferase